MAGMSKQASSRQIVISSSVALCYALFSIASSRKDVLDILPEGSKLRRAIESYRDACSRSPSLSAVRALSTALTLLWAQSVRLHNVSIIDIFWSISFVVSSIAYNAHGQAAKAFSGRKVLVTALTGAWATRLSTYLWWRNHMSAHGVGVGDSIEDFRYQKFRAFWDRKGLSYWWFSLIQVFGLQGLFSLVVSAPLQAAVTRPQPQHFTSLDFLGILSWMIGYVFEHAGDLTLTAFKSNPAFKGTVLQEGLWAYTRHPNYFGNAMMWWGIWLIACATEGGWRSFYGPLFMNYLLTNVSGAKLLEKTMRRTKPGFARYMDSTPEFVPWGLIRVW